jgi:hypothetical protein
MDGIYVCAFLPRASTHKRKARAKEKINSLTCLSSDPSLMLPSTTTIPGRIACSCDAFEYGLISGASRGQFFLSSLSGQPATSRHIENAEKQAYMEALMFFFGLGNPVFIIGAN